MKKIYLFLLLCCLHIAAFGTVVTVYSTGSSGTGNTGYISGYPLTNAANSLTRSTGNIAVQHGRTTTVATTNLTARGYAVFDLSSIPQGSTITSVTYGWYVSAYTAGTASGFYYTYGFPGDLSKYTNVHSLWANVSKSDTVGPLLAGTTGGSVKYQLAVTAAATGYGTAVGNVTQTLANRFFTDNIGTKVTICMNHVSQSTATTPKIYTIIGETGNTTSTTTASHAPYLTINYTAPSTCSGTPSAGAAVASTHAGNSTTGITLDVAGATKNASITYQWQSSTTSATAGFSNISGATNRTYSFTSISSKTYYKCVVTCSASSSSATSSVDSITTFATSSCTPYHYYQYYVNYASSTPVQMSGYTSFAPITMAGDINTLRDSSFGSPTSYTDRTADINLQDVTLYKTYTHTITMRPGSFGSMVSQVWIDYNNDGTFQNSESIGGGGITANAASNISLSAIPGTVSSGYKRMRVVLGYSSYQTYPFNYPCPTGTTGATFYYGETRDYLINVIDPPPSATASPTSLTFSPTTTGTTSAALVTVLSGAFLLPTSGTVTVTAPTNYTVCSTAGGTYSSTYTISYSSATITANSIYVKFSPPAASTYSGNITITGGGLASALNIPVTGNGAAACSATPSAGSATSTPTSGSNLTTFNLSLTGATAAGGLTYQWESSPDNTTWTAISGATNIAYSFSGMTANTYYHCIVTCPTYGSATSASQLLTFVLPSASCTPSIATGPTSGAASCTTYAMSFCGATTVGGVAIGGATGTVTDNVACNSTGYRDRTALSVTMYKGNSYNVSITFGGGASVYSVYSQWWIDFNSNGTFESTETVGYNSTSFSSGVVALTIPAGVASGTYRMRAVTPYTSYVPPAVNPCMTGYTYGEARDYTVIITNQPPVVVATPTSLNFGVVTSGTTSTYLTSVLTGSSMVASTSLTVTAPTDFQVSPDGTTWSNTFSISVTGSTLAATSIYARYNAPASAGTSTGNITITGGGIVPSTYNIAVNGTSAANCSGTITAGTTVATPASATASSSIVLSLTGGTVAGGLQYQWMQSSTGTGGWTNITGETNPTTTVTGLSATTYYYCLVYCAASGSISYSSVKQIVLYCTPTFYYNATSCSSGYATVATAANHFKVNGASGTSIDDGTLCNGSGFKDQTSSYSVTLNAATTYTFTAGNSGSYTTSYQVWIDFNSDGAFDATESVGGIGLATGGVRTFTVAIPAGSAAIAPGTYRMRVEGEYSYHSYPALYSCPTANTALSQYYGEVRDYTVNLNVPPTLNYAPTSIVFPTTTTGTSSSPMQFYMQCFYLTPSAGSLTISSSNPSDFQVFDPGSSSYVGSYTIAYTAGTVALTSVNVRFSPAAATSYSGTISIAGGGFTTSTVAVSGNGAAICSGTPTAGTTSMSPTTGNASTIFTATCSGFTASGGISFQWQSSPDGSSWTNVSGATNYIYYFTGISATTYYRCNVTCSASSSTATSATCTANFFPPSSCTPGYYYNASTYPMPLATTTTPFRIAGVTTLVDAAGPSSAGSTGAYGYVDNTATTMTCTMNAGTTYAVTTAGSASYTMSEQVWIDFNNDGTFQSSESVGGAALGYTAPHSFNITIPAGSAGITPGTFRMRAIAEYYYHTYPGINPCPNGSTASSYYYGDIRDYKVTINVPPTGSATPSTLAFAPTTTGTSSAAMTSTFTGLFMTPTASSITVTAPANFDVFDPGSSSWTNSYTVAYTGGAITHGIQVRFSPTAVTAYSGNVTVTGGGITTVNIAVTGNGAAACSGTPTAGTAACSPGAGNGSTAFTLTCTGYSVSGGITFQWQSCSTSGGTYTNISGATNSTYSFTGISATTYYQCVVSCSFSSLSATTAYTAANWFPASSCTPAYYYSPSTIASLATATYPFRIVGASGTLLDATAASTSGTTGAYGYQDRTATSITCTMNAGTTYSVSTSGSTGYTQSEQIWIDFNSDGTFQSSESVGGASGLGYTSPHNFTITIPSASAGIAPGTYRMRAISEYYYHTYPSLNPCPPGTTAGSWYYGDVRDYKVTIQVPPTGVASPTAITFPATLPTTSASAINTTIIASYLTPSSGALTVTAPTNFAVWNGSSFVSSYTISYSASTVALTTIQVNFTPPSVGSFSGNLTITGGGLTTVNVALNGTGSSACSGTPTAGTAVATPATAGSGTSITLSLSGASTSSGLTYQWQSASTSGGTYTNITGATNATYTFTGLTATTYYKCVVTCTASGSSATSAFGTATFVLSTATPCTPAPTSASYACTSYTMSFVGASSGSVRLNGASSTSINDVLACNSTGYYDRTALSVTLNQATSYNLSLTFGGGASSYACYSQWWIDFNSNGTFETTESVGYNSTAFTSGVVTLTIPPTAPSGRFRMRGVCDYNSSGHSGPGMSPCMTSYSYGEGRDYTVTIVNPAPFATTAPTSYSFGVVGTGTTTTSTAIIANAYFLTPSSDNVTVTAPSPYLVASTAGGSFASSYTIAYTGATVTNSSVYVRFPAPGTAGTYSGNVTLTGGGISTLNVPVTAIAANACTGTPAAGTASSTPTAGVSGTTFTLSLSGATSALGVLYQWQSSTSGSAGTFSDITGATNATYGATGLTGATFFQCVLTCGYSGISTTSSITQVNVYCTPLWYYASSVCGYPMVVATSGNPFKLVSATDSIIDGTACNSIAFVDNYATTNVTLNAGTTYNATCAGSASYAMSYQIWIDFNNDATFQSSESIGGVGGSTGLNRTFSVAIPSGSAGVSPGVYRMRVIGEYYYHSYPGLNPCPPGTTAGSWYYGEGRDYKVTINVPPVAVATPASLSFPVTTITTTSSPLTTALVAGYLVPASGNITVTAPTDFKVYDAGSSSYVSSYSYAYTGAASTATIQAVFQPTAVATSTGNITVTGGGLTTLNIPVNGTGGPLCSGTPSAGSAAASPGAGNTTTVFTLTVSGYTTAGGLTFQWQSASSSGGTYSNITGATNSSYTFTGISATTYYQCVVTCSASGLSATSAITNIGWYPASSCTPGFYYNASTYPMPLATSTYPFQIAGASSTLIDANGPSSAGSTSTYGYLDNSSTTMTCTLNAGTTYNVTSAGSASYTMANTIWIDFNNNGAFEASESVGGSALSTVSPKTYTITIPSGAAGVVPGTYRMRAGAEYNYHNYGLMNPCPDGTTTNSFYYGDYRDYKVTINVPPTAVATPNPIPFPPTVVGGTPTVSTAVLNASYLLPTTGTITVTSSDPTNFLVWDAGSSSYQPSYTIGYTSRTVTAASVQVQFNPAAATSYSANINITGGSLASAYPIVVTGTGAGVCSGTPTAGTASISPSMGGTATAFTLSVTGYTVAGGLQFQWQSSADNSTWSNVSGATLSTYAFTGISASTYYRCVVTCSASTLSANTASIFVGFYPPSTCTPAWYYTTGCTNGMTIGNPSLPFMVTGASGSISDASSCVAAGYIDQSATTMTCTLNAGTAYTFTTGSSASYSMSFQVWIDFNRNGTFESTESVGGVAGSAAATHTFTVNIPSATAGVSPGLCRMRVEGEYNYHSYPSLYVCPSGSSSLSQYYGEVRDYKITINVPPTASATPSTLAFSPTVVSTSSTANTTLSALYLTPSSGILTVTSTNPAIFKVLDPGSSSYVSSYTYSYTGSTSSPYTITGQFTPTAVAAYTGTVTVTGGGLTTLNIPMTGNGSAACSGTPTAGTAATSPTFGGTSTAFTLSLSGASATGGITFQWQSSPDASSWTNITGATTSTYNFTGISASTYYRCLVTCSYSSTTSTTSPVVIAFIPPSGCTPAWYYTTMCSNGMVLATTANHFKINGLSGTNINDGTACVTTGYIDQAASMGVTLQAGSTYTVTTGNSGSYALSTQVWIDFNNNGSFESSESVGGGAAASGAVRTFSITLPAGGGGIAPGTYRMRAEAEYNYHAYPYLSPCPNGSSASSFYYGEVRDYSVTVNVPPVYSLSPTTISFPTTLVGSSSAALSSTFTGSYLSPSIGTLTVSAPTNFQVYNTTSGTWVSSYTIAYTGYTVAATTIQARFNPPAASTYSGTIVITGGGLGIVSLNVTGTGANMCTGTPTAGTCSASPATASGATTVTMSLSGTSVVAGLTYQWQSSSDSSSWSSITGATNTTYVFSGLTTNTYYRCIVGCSASGLSSTSNGAKVTWVMPTACTPSWIYATNACSSYTMSIGTYDLVGIIGSIHDASACDNTGYLNRTSLSTTLLTGATYVATISTNTAASSYNVNTQVWIDFNSNGTFEGSEIVGGNNAWTGTGHSVTLTIPSGVGIGTLRMRVENEYNYHTYPTMDPCPNGTGTFYYGEVRDYTVVLVNPSTCAGTPTAGSVTATATSGCTPVSSTLSLPSTAGVSGLTYQWETSPNGSSWSNISGATDPTYNSSSTATTTPNTTYYRCTIVCTSSAGTSVSSVRSITATPAPSAIGGTPVVCIGSSTTLTNTLTGGTWSSSATSVASVNPSTGSVYGVAAGSAVISYTTSGCSPATSSFTVNTSPAAITGFTSICVGGSTTLHDATTGGTWSSASSSVATVDPSTGVTTAVAAGTTTITYSNGCGTAATTSWTTNVSPSAIVGPSSICTLSTGTFTDSVSGGTWSNSPTTFGTIDATTGVFSASSTAGTSTLTYTIGYCSITGTATVGITSPGSISGTTTTCFGSATTLTNATSGGAWSSSAPSIATVNPSSGLVTGVSSGTATITYSTGCGSDATTGYTVNGSPVTISAATTCSQSTLNLTASTGAGTYTYSWSGPLGFTSASATPSISSAPTTASGIYSVAATQAGCTSSTSYWVRVDTSIQATVVASPASICPGSSSTVTDAISSPVTGAYALTAIPYAPLTLTSVTAGPSGVAYSTVSLPFSFNYYGTSYSTVTINTQGYINFGTPTYSYAVVSLPSASAPLGMIAPFWHYMNAATGSIQYTTLGTAPNRKFVVRYNAVADYAGGGQNTAQIVLFETSNIIDMFISKANSTGTYNGVCGIQNPSGTVAVTVPGQNNVNYSINNSVAGTAWRFARPSYSYAWTPATGLSSTTSVSPVATLTTTTTYTATVTDAYNGCTAANTAVGTVNVYNLPAAYTVTPATGCTIGTTIGIPNSESGVSYQLYRGATAVGSAITGTSGSPVTFPSVTTAGTYKIIGSLLTGGCQTIMTDSCIVNTTPSTFTITSGNGCTSTGVNICQSGSTSGVSYQLFNGASSVGTPVTGTGSAICFGTQTAAGTYTVVATSATGGCQATMTGSTIIYTNPAAYTVTGGNGCTASCITIGTSNSQSSATYQLYRGATAIGSPASGSTGVGVTFGTQCVAGYYTVLATGPGSCTTQMNGIDTISTTPTITLGANPSVCQPLTSSSISYSGATASPTTYNLTWGSTALADGFSNVTGGTLSGGTIALAVPSTSVSGVYTGSITVSNGFCTSNTYSFTLTVYATPAGSITSAVVPCMGYSTSIVFTGTPGATVAYQINHGSILTGTLTGGTYTLTTGAITAPTTYTLYDVHNPVCSDSINRDTVITPTPMQWVGGTTGSESDWNTSTNWACGFVPGVTDDAIIPSGTTYSPVIGLSASGTTRNITIASGATVTIGTGGTLNVKGGLNNSGSILGAGTTTLNGTTAQIITGIGSVKNLTLNNSAGATIATAAKVFVKGVLAVSSGTLATGDSLVLYSDSLGTARVASLPGSGAAITGTTKVMQWIPGGRRAYRFWSHPFTSNIGLEQVQNYIDVTGPGGATNGFTTTASNAPSAFRYNPLVGNSAVPSDPGWKQFASAYTTTDSNRIHQYQGIRLYFRGAKGEGLGYLPYTPSSVTVAQWGTLNQGTQTVTMAKGSSSGQDYNMVGNPYASPVDIGSVVYNANLAGYITGTGFYVWNPFLGSAGQFQAVVISSVTPYYLQANTCFQVRAAHNGDQLTFAESNKGATANTNLLKVNPEFVALTIYDANYHAWDMLNIKFNDDATNNDDSRFDAGKPTSPADLNFYSLSADNQKLAIDGRPYKADGIIPLGIQSSVAQDFIIKTDNIVVPEGGSLYLHDKLLKQYVLLQQGTEYRFSISEDKQTQGEARFELSMAPTQVNSNKGLQVALTPNPATEEVTIGFTNGKAEEVNVRVLDLSGVSIYNQNLGTKQNGSVTVQLGNFASGVYMVELTSGNQKVVQRLIKE